MTSQPSQTVAAAEAAELWVDDVVMRLRDLLEDRLSRFPLAVPAAELAESCTSGKLLRGRASILVASAFGSDDREFSVASACALELLHTASLLHDDIIDGSTLRRGRPALHVATDQATAILIADLLIALAFELAAPHGEAAVAPLAAAFAELCEGQLLEPALEWGPDALPGIERYAGLKTGALFSAAFELGAASAVRPASERERFRGAGRALGLAFQFADDLLDVRGDALELGKDSGADLRNGVPTFPLWSAYRRLSRAGNPTAIDPERLAAEAGSAAIAALAGERISALVGESRALLPAAARPELLDRAVRTVLPDLDSFPPAATAEAP